MNKKFLAISALFILVLIGVRLIPHQPPREIASASVSIHDDSFISQIHPTPSPQKVIATRSNSSAFDALKKKMNSQLDRKYDSRRTLEIPPPVMTIEEEPIAPALLPSTQEEKQRAQGRKARESLPMGVVLWDNTPIYENESGGKKIYSVYTGDFVRVLSQGLNRIQIHPGLDVFLVATTKKIEPAGKHLPDKSGWIDKSKLNIFEPEQAKEFLLETTPVTLGNEPNFSTLSFYERAMKNPDPVVHRVIGPRLISVVTLHADYASSWFTLYRDRDPKIRAATLAFIRERGIATNRLVIEDLIQRLVELTQNKATGETEVEALAVLSILKESGHPRVPSALMSFIDTWKQIQGQQLNEALEAIINP